MAGKVIKISVRDLAETYPPIGSIDQRDSLMSDPILGMEIHQSIQSERAENSDTYRAEVPVFHSFVHGKWTIEVSGRVDGVDFEGGTVICEEIKSTWSPRRLMRAIESNPLHPQWSPFNISAKLLVVKASAFAD